MRKPYQALIRTLLLLGAVMLTACGTQSPTCIDADDFGFPKFDIDALGYNVSGTYTNQVSEWKNTSQVYNGDKLVIAVRPAEEDGGPTSYDPDSRWTSWYNGTVEGPTCTFSEGMCPDPNATEAPLVNPPCWFTNGVGLYGLIAPPPPADNNPNATDTIKRSPPDTFYTFHLAKPENSAYNFSQELPDTMENGPLYFKIQDRYYSDNGGSYKVVIKRGTKNAQNGPVAKVIYYVRTTLTNAAKSIYQNVTKNDGTPSDFVRGAKALLVLYIVIVSIMFIFGMVQMTQGMLIVHLIKIAIIIQLISPSSWDFFNTYFFVFFIEGTEQLITLLLKPVAGGAASGFDFFDVLIKQFTSSETTAKMLSLMFTSDGAGFLFVIVMYAILLQLLLAVAKAMLFFLMSLIAIAILICTAPLFISFMMFQVTRDFFNRWVKQFYSYSLQPILIFAALGMVAVIILQEFHRVLGFRVCWDTWWSLDFLGLGGSILDFKFWIPSVRQEDEYRRIIELPEGRINPNTGVWEGSYEGLGDRYIDLPFLDPNDADDYARILDIFQGNYVSFGEVFILVVLVYLMFRFNDMVPGIARTITDTANPFANIEAATKNAWAGGVGLLKDVANLATAGRYGQAVERVRALIDKPLHAWQDAIGGSIDKMEALKDRVVDNMPGIRQYNSFSKSIDEAAKRGEDARHAITDKIGRHLEAGFALKDTLLSHVKHEMSGGLLGKSANGDSGVDGKTNMDLVMEKLGKARNWDADTLTLRKAQAEGLAKFGSFGNAGKAAVALSLFNPAVGAIAFGGWLAMKAYEYKKTVDRATLDYQNKLNDPEYSAKQLEKERTENVDTLHKLEENLTGINERLRQEEARLKEEGNSTSLEKAALLKEQAKAEKELALAKEHSRSLLKQNHDVQESERKLAKVLLKEMKHDHDALGALHKNPIYQLDQLGAELEAAYSTFDAKSAAALAKTQEGRETVVEKIDERITYLQKQKDDRKAMELSNNPIIATVQDAIRSTEATSLQSSIDKLNDLKHNINTYHSGGEVDALNKQLATELERLHKELEDNRNSTIAKIEELKESSAYKNLVKQEGLEDSADMAAYKAELYKKEAEIKEKISYAEQHVQAEQQKITDIAANYGLSASDIGGILHTEEINKVTSDVHPTTTSLEVQEQQLKRVEEDINRNYEDLTNRKERVKREAEERAKKLEEERAKEAELRQKKKQEEEEEERLLKEKSEHEKAMREAEEIAKQQKEENEAKAMAEANRVLEETAIKEREVRLEQLREEKIQVERQLKAQEREAAKLKAEAEAKAKEEQKLKEKAERLEKKKEEIEKLRETKEAERIEKEKRETERKLASGPKAKKD